jgi:hypothetical protein
MATPTAAYLARCDPAHYASLLDAVRGLHLTAPYADWPRTSLARPLFQQSSGLAALSDDLGRLTQLLDDLGPRCFGDDRTYLEAQGVDNRLAGVILRGRTGARCDQLRADVLVEHGAAKIIELNRGSGLGGFDNAVLAQALLRRPAFAEFAVGHGLRYEDTLGIVADQLSAAGRAITGGDPPTIAMIEETGARSTSGGTCDRLSHSLRARGLVVILGELDDLRTGGGVIRTSDGTRVDVVFRYFYARHLLTSPADRARMDALTDAHRNGQVALVPPLDADIAERKAAMALLRDPQVWPRLSPDEQDLVERRIPWTRLLGTRFPTLTAAERHALQDECRARRRHLVLKPADGSRSSGVLLGASHTDREWRELLPAIDNYVVQQRVIPDDELVPDPDTGRLEAWQVVWGIFHLAGRYAGSLLRARPSAVNGIIGGPGHNSSRGVAFTYGQSAPEPLCHRLNVDPCRTAGIASADGGRR